MAGLQHVEHVIVVMLENRSFDHLTGLLYSSEHPPRHFLPAGSEALFNGISKDYWNPANRDFFEHGAPPEKVYMKADASSTTVPEHDPQELFEHINFQLFGSPTVTPNQAPTMNGFLVSYEQVAKDKPEEIMECYLPEQVPVLSALARNFAISDAWYASVPSQTWPNRAFIHLGTSRGEVNNFPYDPFTYDVPTIFNVLKKMKVNWVIYNDSWLESATRLQFPQLWDLLLEPHFQGFDDFEEDARHGKLPAYSFVEPSFVTDPNDAHPPHDMLAAEQFLWRIWNAVSTGPAWDSTLLIITFDEHGGCIDHQPPPWGAVPPDECRAAQGFGFDRFGVRVPTIVVSPWIEAGTVFRSPGDVPYDHTSVLATLRDWLKIGEPEMLKSRRVAAAPTVDHLLTRSSPRTEIPAIAYPTGIAKKVHPKLVPNDFQKAMVVAFAHRVGLRGGSRLLTNLRHREHVEDFFHTWKERHHKRSK